MNGQYASQGKLGVAVLGSHVKKEVINIKSFLLTVCSAFTVCPVTIVNNFCYF